MLSGEARAHLRHVQLTLPEQQMLEYLAQRGGECPWDWSKLKPAARAMVAGLINKQLCREREYVTHAAQVSGELYLALTEQGRSIVEQIERMKIAAPAPAAAPEGGA